MPVDTWMRTVGENDFQAAPSDPAVQKLLGTFDRCKREHAIAIARSLFWDGFVRGIGQRCR